MQKNRLVLQEIATAMPKKRAPEAQPVEFECRKCKNLNAYPASVIPGKPNDGATSILKKCLFCGEENKVVAPDDHVFPRDAEIFRGI